MCRKLCFKLLVYSLFFYYIHCRELEVTPEVVDALNDVWDKQLSMLDWDEVSAEDIKSPFFIFVMCAYVVCQHLACVVELDLLQ